METLFLITGYSVLGFGLYKYYQLWKEESGLPNRDNTFSLYQTPANCLQMRDACRCVSVDRMKACKVRSTRTGNSLQTRPDYYVANGETGQKIVMNVEPQVGELITPTDS